MINWVLIENGEIQLEARSLPKNWRNHSGLYLSASNLEFLRTLGWYRVIPDGNYYDPEFFEITGHTYEIGPEYVQQILTVKEYTLEEKQQQKQEKFNAWLNDIRQCRNSYLKETDWTELASVRSTKTQEWIAAYENYRQQLRDFPSQFSEITYDDLQWPVLHLEEA